MMSEYMRDYSTARYNMVECQLRPNRVTDEAVIDAFLNIPRENFIPKSKVGLAYIDEDIEVAPGRCLGEPRVLARLLEEAKVKPKDMVLDIGCASGYSTAIFAQIASMVVGVEQDETLAAMADANLSSHGTDNIIVFKGPLNEGCAKQAPYDVIFVHGAVAEIPETILKQLADGGRLVTVLLDEEGVGRATLFQRFGESVNKRALFDASCPILPGFEPKTGFVF